MSNNTFKAIQTKAIKTEQYETVVVERSIDDLPPGELLVDVRYSSLNYKDALSASGNPGVTKVYPHTPGIDAAGVVLKDTSGTFQEGDEVVVCGYDLGMNTSGGLAQRIRVPANWAVKLPSTLSMKEAMIIGTAGFTSALCVDKILQMGAKPEDGPVLVSGATGGVGSFSVALLSHLGFSVTALTGKLEQSEWLVSLGAKQVIERGAMSEATKRPVAQPQWAHAIDCVGGEILSNILKSLQYGGSVAICGMTASPSFNITVFPFILRNVNLLGIDCVEQPLSRKSDNWNALATKYKLPNLDNMAEPIKLEQVSEYLTRVLNGHARGRYLVNLSD